MTLIERNETRYPTEDLCHAFAWFESKVESWCVKQYTETQDNCTPWHPYAGQITVKTISLNAIDGNGSIQFPKSRLGRMRQPRYCPRSWSSRRPISLQILASRNMPNLDPLRELALSHSEEEEVEYLAREAVAELLTWYWCVGHLDHSHPDASNVVGLGPRLINREANLPTVRILKRRVDSTSGPSLTEDEKIQRLLQAHGNPEFGMQGSSKTGAYLWREKIYAAEEFYDRERDRREAWGDKLREIPGYEDRKGHMTFPEYLEYCARHLRKHGRMP